MNNEEVFVKQRNHMVEYQLKSRDIKSERVLQVMRKIPRHEFVPKELQFCAYDDTPLKIGFGQTISQPYIVAFMTQIAEIQPADKVLEIGTGSGYQTAVLCELCKEVYSLEIVSALGKEAAKRLKNLGHINAHVKIADGYNGWKDKGPFDHIVITAATKSIPAELMNQLKDTGKLIVPLIENGNQDLYLLSKSEDGKVKRKRLLPVAFVLMTGKAEVL